MDKNNQGLGQGSFYRKIISIFCGLLLAIVIIEIGLRIGGFILLSLQEYKNSLVIKQKGACRIMCLGESTTRKQYPPCLEKILNQRDVGIKFSVIDKGKASTNTAAILSEVEVNLDKYQPDIIIAMMGSNDKGVVYYKDIPEANTGVFRYCRAYRFLRLIYLEILRNYKKEEPLGLNRLSLSKKNNPEKIEAAFKKVNFSTEELVESITKMSFQNNKNGSNLENARLDFSVIFKIEEYLKKLLELNPNNKMVLLRLGQIYLIQGKSAEAEEVLLRVLKLDPQDSFVYLGLGWIYLSQGRFAKVEQAFKKAIEINPKNNYAYVGLGYFYREQSRFIEAEQPLKKAIENNPRNYAAYMQLGWVYRDQKRFIESEQYSRKALELNPHNALVYGGLGWLYRDQGKISEAEQALKKALEINPKNDRVCGGLATIYGELGNNELSKLYARKANILREEYYRPTTINNYRRLKQILDKRKISLVCMQYPMRSIEPLKKIFREDEGVIFVDNEKIFKDATRKEGYKEYFVDMFAGDFGHCTPKGNNLLAENIANIILRKIFNK